MKKGDILYQICVIGKRKHFESEGKFNSKNVFINVPTQEQIDEFIEKCTNSEHPNSLYDIQKEGIKVKIIELEVI